MSQTILVAGGCVNGTYSSQILFSKDGTTWTNSANYSAIFGYAQSYSQTNAIANNGTTWVAGGGKPSPGPFSVIGYSSDGGNTWTGSPTGTTCFPNGVANDQIVYGNGIFAAVGYNMVGNLATSPDGITWTTSSSASTICATYGAARFISYVNSTWILGLGGSTTTIAYSTDCQNWTMSPCTIINSTSGVQYGVNGALYVNGQYYIYGLGSSGMPNWISSSSLSSPNASWTQYPSSQAASSACWNGQYFIICNFSYGINKYSADLSNAYNTGLTYTPRYVTNTPIGVYACGNNSSTGISVSSSNPPTTWTNLTTPGYSQSGYTALNQTTTFVTVSYICQDPPAPTITATCTYTYLTVNYTLSSFGYGATSIQASQYSIDGGTTYIATSQSSNPILIPINQSNFGKTLQIRLKVTNNLGCTSVASNTFSVIVPYYPCFAKRSQILTAYGYTPVEKLHPGDMIQTVRHGFVPIWKIGKKKIHHPASKDRRTSQLYRLSPDRYPALTEPLVMTGGHSILVKEWSSDQEKARAIKVHEGKIYITDDHYRLPACADENAEVHEPAGEYTIYHIALENPDYLMNCGIYANGLLLESCSKRYLAELSGMELLK